MTEKEYKTLFRKNMYEQIRRLRNDEHLSIQCQRISRHRNHIPPRRVAYIARKDNHLADPKRSQHHTAQRPIGGSRQRFERQVRKFQKIIAPGHTLQSVATLFVEDIARHNQRIAVPSEADGTISHRIVHRIGDSSVDRPSILRKRKNGLQQKSDQQIFLHLFEVWIRNFV